MKLSIFTILSHTIEIFVFENDLISKFMFTVESNSAIWFPQGISWNACVHPHIGLLKVFNLELHPRAVVRCLFLKNSVLVAEIGCQNEVKYFKIFYIARGLLAASIYKLSWWCDRINIFLPSIGQTALHGPLKKTLNFLCSRLNQQWPRQQIRKHIFNMSVSVGSYLFSSISDWCFIQ